MSLEPQNSLPNASPDHELGQYRSWRLANNRLVPVDLAWISTASTTTPTAHRVLPHGEPSIAILRQRAAQGLLSDLRLVICGPYYKARHYQPAPGEELIAVRLKPETGACLFGVMPSDYADATIAPAPPHMENAFSKTLKLGEHAEATTVAACLKNELQHFAGCSEAASRPEQIAAEMIRAHQGDIRFRDITAMLEVSERNLRRRFSDHVGCSPKTYARHLQITAAALAAEKQADPNWANIAAGAGFHDQPHMINAFRAETGLTPKAFHAERRALMHSV